VQVIKSVAATLAILAILALLAVYGGSRWVMSHKEEIAEKVGTMAGLAERTKRECAALELQFRREWDEAVDNHTIARRENDLVAMRHQIDRLCKPK
jgi:hypothetical protein